MLEIVEIKVSAPYRRQGQLALPFILVLIRITSCNGVCMDNIQKTTVQEGGGKREGYLFCLQVLE
jgi:hypothetical protein